MQEGELVGGDIAATGTMLYLGELRDGVKGPSNGTEKLGHYSGTMP